MWFSIASRALLLSTQREQASAAAGRITQFVQEIERQMGWMTQLPWSTNPIEEWRFDAVRIAATRFQPSPKSPSSTRRAVSKHWSLALPQTSSAARRTILSAPQVRPRRSPASTTMGRFISASESEPYMTHRDPRRPPRLWRGGRGGQSQVHLGRRISNQGRQSGTSLCGGCQWATDCSSGYQSGAAQHRSVETLPQVMAARRAVSTPSLVEGDVM